MSDEKPPAEPPPPLEKPQIITAQLSQMPDPPPLEKPDQFIEKRGEES